MSRTENAAVIEHMSKLIGLIEDLKREWPLTKVHEHPDDYWEGFSDLSYAIAEFIGKDLASLSGGEDPTRSHLIEHLKSTFAPDEKQL
jgi:hypothetical protein